MVLHVHPWRGLSILFEPGREPGQDGHDAVGSGRQAPARDHGRQALRARGPRAQELDVERVCRPLPFRGMLRRDPRSIESTKGRRRGGLAGGGTGPRCGSFVPTIWPASPSASGGPRTLRESSRRVSRARSPITGCRSWPIGSASARSGSCSRSGSMRSDLRQALDRQAAWQRARSTRSWAEKLRTAVIMRQASSALPFRSCRTTSSTPSRRMASSSSSADVNVAVRSGGRSETSSS